MRDGLWTETAAQDTRKRDRELVQRPKLPCRFNTERSPWQRGKVSAGFAVTELIAAQNRPGTAGLDCSHTEAAGTSLTQVGSSEVELKQMIVQKISRNQRFVLRI